MIRRTAFAALAALSVLHGVAWAQGAPAGGKAFDSGASGTVGSFLTMLSDRIDHTIEHIPKLGRYLLSLPELFNTQTNLLLIGIVLVGLAAELVARLLLNRVRGRIFARYAAGSPLRGFLFGALLDGLALVALWIAARLVAREVGDPASMQGQVARQVLEGLIYWRVYNFIFRTWLHPNSPDGRIAPVDNETARRLLVGLNVIILLP
ncbi:MAG: hypothetical protein JOY81_02620, partial [Alphaproteobacteria bacterium]|nr:hypothetical protein [Alphaproteobacteria bacterium]